MENKKLLLVEYRLFNSKNYLITEDVNGVEKIFLTGKIQEAEAMNQNERWYPKNLLEREVNNFKQIIASNSTQALGELDHPDSTVINLANASHIMRDIWWKGNEVWGKVEVLNGPDPYGTPKGRVLESLVRRKLSIGISSRGVGSTMEDSKGREIVQEDFQIITFDIVSNPSTRNAFLMKEHYAKISKPLSESQWNKLKYFRLNNVLNKILK